MTETTTTPRKRIDVAKPCCGRMRGHAPTCPEGQKANTPTGQAFLDAKKECAATATGNPVDCGGCEEHAAPAPTPRPTVRAVSFTTQGTAGNLLDAILDDIAERIVAKLHSDEGGYLVRPADLPALKAVVAPEVGCGTINLPVAEGAKVEAGDLMAVNAEGKVAPAQSAPAEPPKAEGPPPTKPDAAAVMEASNHPDEKAIEARVKAGAKVGDLAREFRISLNRAKEYVEAFKPAAAKPTVVEAASTDAAASGAAKDVTPPPKFEALREAAVEYAQKTSKDKLVELLKKYDAAGPDGAVKLSLIPEDKRAAFMAELKTNA